MNDEYPFPRAWSEVDSEAETQVRYYPQTTTQHAVVVYSDEISSRSRLVGGLLQLPFPGLGRLYLRQRPTAHTLMAGWLIGSLLCFSLVGAWLGMPILAGVHAWSFVDGLILIFGLGGSDDDYYCRDSDGRFVPYL